jgi:stress responsive alpha/beta barrel protein
VLTHVILLRFNDQADIAEAVDRLNAFVGVIESIRSLSTGADVRGLETSYDMALITTHDDLDGLVAYQTHPVHQEFSAWLATRASARAVVDFLTTAS